MSKVLIELIGKDQATEVFARSTDKISSDLKGLERTADSSLGRISGLFGTVKANWLAAGAAIAGGTAVVMKGVDAYFDMYRQVTESADAVGKFSLRIGISTEALSEFQFAAQRSGVDITALNNGLQRMVRNVSEAAVGIGSAKDEIKELGLDARELNQQSPEETFFSIARAMEQVTNEADRVRLAYALFGREAIGLNVLFKEGEAGIKALMEAGRRLGVTITEDMARKAAEAQDSILDLNEAWSGLRREFVFLTAGPATDAIQILTDFLVVIRENADAVGDTADAILSLTPVYNWYKAAWKALTDDQEDATGAIEKQTSAWQKFVEMLWQVHPVLSRIRIYRELIAPPEIPREQYYIQRPIPKPPEIIPPPAGGETDQERRDRERRESVYKQRIDRETQFYQELLGVQGLSAERFEKLWERYKEKRLIQIDLEAKTMRELGVDAGLVSDIVKQRTAAIDVELEKMRENLESTMRISPLKQVELDVPLLSAGLGAEDIPADKWLAIWEQYKNDRLIQIEAEKQKLLDAGASQTAINAKIAADIEALYDLRDDRFTRIADKEIAFLDELLASDQLTTQEREALSEDYSERRIAAIQKEADAWLKLGIDADIVNRMIAKRSQEVTDEIVSYAQRGFDLEASLLAELLESERLTSEERKAIAEQYTKKRIEQIQREGEAWKRLGIDTDLVNKVMTDRTARVTEDIRKSTDVWSQNFERFSETVDSAFEAGFFDVFKDGISDMGDVWTQFVDMLTESWARAMAKMATDMILHGPTGQGGGFMGLMGTLGQGLTGFFGGGITGGSYAPIHIGAGGTTAFGLQEGGFVSSPRIALIGEVPEVVIPLNKFDSLIKNVIPKKRPKLQEGGFVDRPIIADIGETPETVISLTKFATIVQKILEKREASEQRESKSLASDLLADTERSVATYANVSFPAQKSELDQPTPSIRTAAALTQFASMIADRDSKKPIDQMQTSAEPISLTRFMSSMVDKGDEEKLPGQVAILAALGDRLHGARPSPGQRIFPLTKVASVMEKVFEKTRDSKSIIENIMPAGVDQFTNQTRLQEGGLVTSPTMALLGEVPELVIPLNKFQMLVNQTQRQTRSEPVNVNINIATPDVTGFKRSHSQVLAAIQTAMRRAQRNL